MSSSTKTGQKLRKRFKKELPFHLMLLPAVVMVVLFKYIPMAGLSIAFQDYSPLYSIFEQEWSFNIPKSYLQHTVYCNYENCSRYYCASYSSAFAE